MQPRGQFSQDVLDWFAEGETLETRADLAPYEPFGALPWRQRMTAAALSVAALVGAVWLIA
jgi:hypothetical protein